MDEFSEEFLAHHGIKGQKWGIRRTPEELGHKPKGTKKKNAVKEYVKSVQKKRAAKKEAGKGLKRTALKEYLRDHPEKLIKYKRVITEAEADEIIKKIEFDRKLQAVRDTELKRGRDKLANITSSAGNVSKLLASGTAIYNSSAAIYNALVDNGVIDSDTTLPSIVTGGGKKKKKDE